MKHKNRTVLAWIGDKLKDYDSFKLTIMPTYSTNMGGWTSVWILFIMLYATIVILKSVLGYSEIKFNKSIEKLTLSQETEIHNITGENGVKFAVAWVPNDGEPINSTIGKIEFNHMHISEAQRLT